MKKRKERKRKKCYMEKITRRRKNVGKQKTMKKSKERKEIGEERREWMKRRNR